MAEFVYQVVLLGKSGPKRDAIKSAIYDQLLSVGLQRADFRLLDDPRPEEIERKSATCAVFVGTLEAVSSDYPALQQLYDDTVPIIPVVNDLTDYSKNVPLLLRPINGMEYKSETDADRVAAVVLENLGLLRTERRIFISYKRDDSSGAANQLADSFTHRGFDCFLDTRSVRPSAVFQDQLWHRMADSDVVLLLDTEHFRDSEWTVAELTQANTTSVQILHLLWPGVEADPTSAFSIFHELEEKDFKNADGLIGKDTELEQATVERIIRELESLRARAIAARHADLFDSISDAARDAGFETVLHPSRYLTLETKEAAIAVMPTVGVPSSDRLHGFLDTVRPIHARHNLYAVYDERGILDRWRTHLNWLSEHLPVRTVENGRIIDWLSGFDK